MHKSNYYCRAGFIHFGDDCEHVVKTQFNAAMPRPAEQIPDEFYSEEAIAARREENKLKYQPTRRPFNRYLLNAAVNQGDR
jgi:hypothetical protein